MYTLNKTEVHSVCCGYDNYNQQITGDVSKTLNSIRSDADHVPCVLVLNDQGGQQMSISYDVTATLRSQTKHHEPTILSYGFEPGVAKRLNPEGRFYNELSPTIRADMGDNQAAVLTIENHPADSRVKVRDDGICQALTERMGTGGGNAADNTVAYGYDSYNQTAYKEVAHTLKSNGGGDDCPRIIVFRDDVTIKIDEEDVAFTLGARDFKGVQCISYQNVTGCLSQGAHPGSYNGQDAYNDMLVTDESIINRKWSAASDEHERDVQLPGHDARQASDTYRGG